MFSSLQSSVVIFLLSCSLVLGAVPQEKHFNFNVGPEKDRKSESVEINFRKNYVQITVDRTDQATSTVLFHDYTQGLNVFKQNGQCFVMDRFDEMPLSIEDWNPPQTAAVGDVSEDNTEPEANTEQNTEQNTEHVNYDYTVLPLAVDRTTLPEAVQDLCPGVIQVFVLDAIREGGDPRDFQGDNTGRAEIYLPGQILHERVKRQLSLGLDRRGGYATYSGNGRRTSGSLTGRYNWDRSWSVDGNLNHRGNRWTLDGRGSYNSRDSTIRGSLDYNRGRFSAGLSGNYNTRTGGYNYGVGITWRF